MNKLLYELQEADNAIAGLSRDRLKLDDGSGLRAERDALAEQVAAAAARVQELDARMAERELELKTTEEKIARQQKRLMSANSAHEVTAFERDLVGLNHARGELDEAILTVMEELEAANARLDLLRAGLQEKTRATVEAEARFASETARIERETAAGRELRESIAGRVDAASLERYDTVARQHHGVAIVHNEKGTCSACGMALTPFALREARDKEWPTCEACGRLLYLEP